MYACGHRRPSDVVVVVVALVVALAVVSRYRGADDFVVVLVVRTRRTQGRLRRSSTLRIIRTIHTLVASDDG